ncbi:DUF2961 domain-containing protein [Niabella ginsengisoli]|uniref:DUF2961 domain-containing protein n=1 Tax=Niabella ginsengisoli TaxID=522298 RepID=UPI0021D42E1D|nr:DUF2961 domain-containing protein [Niabella ginsengisoli]
MIILRSILLLFCVGVAVLYPCTNLFSQSGDVDFLSELNRMKDVSRMPEYFEGSEVKQVSSYDRTGGNDDGFSGKYSFLRKDEKGNLVIFEEKNSGVIERIWTPTPTDDTLEFYFDGASIPTFSIRFRDLFTGNIAPFISPLAGAKVGGFYSYIPIPYNKGCKIVLRGDKLMFLQIQFRQLNTNYHVKSFSNKISANEKSMLKSIASLWQRDEQSVSTIFSDKTNCIKKELTLNPGDILPFASLTDGGRVLGIEIMPSKFFEGIHKQIDIRITWDAEKNAAINIPVADFFGYAFGERSMNSMLLGSTPSKLFCYLPMPFDRSATLELVYRKNETIKNQPTISLETSVYHTDEKRDPKKEGKLYSFWNSSPPALGKPHIF